MKRNYNLVLLLFFLFAFIKQNIAQEFKITENGLKCKIFPQNPNSTKAKIGDYISYHLVLKNQQDSIIQNTYLDKRGAFVDRQVRKANSKTDFFEIFPLLAEGDSALVLISVDSIAKYSRQSLPAYMKKGTEMKYFFKILKIRSPEEYALIVDKQREIDEKIINEYLTKNKLIAKTTASGLRYLSDKEGTGEQPSKGKIVSVHYRGTLIDGKEFDNSYQRKQPIEFPLGEGRVIKGWEEGIALMKKGEKGRLIIPSYLAYGSRGTGDMIPAHAILIFEVELVDIK